MAPDWVRRAFGWWGRGHARKLILGGLDGLRVSGLDAAKAEIARRPVIFAANHSAWWDGVLMVALNERMGVDSRVLMDAKRMRDFPWFQAFGAVPLDRTATGKSHADLARAAAHLNGPGRCLWIFPQGKHRSPNQRPMGLRRGVQVVSEATESAVVPVSIRYEFQELSVPGAFVHFGRAVEPGPELLPRLEDALILGLDQITAGLDAPEERFELLLAGRPPGGLGSAALRQMWNLFARGGHRA
ncbi:lysophospholipid acyltransferase family protein [Myxococcota bacterium]|nr:lysophospholipid acyltransferase family protein [Myxococcota bacterium]